MRPGFPEATARVSAERRARRNSQLVRLMVPRLHANIAPMYILNDDLTWLSRTVLGSILGAGLLIILFGEVLALAIPNDRVSGW